jgi:hypothetical protein
VTVSGATAYGIKSNEAVWGWMTGAFSGKSLSVAGVANGTFTFTWFNTTAGTVISTSSVTVSGGTLTATVPTTSVADIAFKALAPLPVQVFAADARKSAEYRPIIAYGHGIIRLLSPVATNSVMQIMTAQGRVVAQRTIPDANMTAVPVGSLSEGVYFVKITSGGKNLLQRLTVGY